MAGSFSYEGDAPAANINVTPLVDVMLVLLVIFMITAPMLQQGVDVNLPKATTGPLKGTVDEQIVISIDRSGTIFLGKGNPIELEQLPKKIAAVMEQRKAEDRKVYIRADTDLAYGRIMEVMGKLHEGGIDQIGLVSMPLDGEGRTGAGREKKAPARS